MCRLSDPSIEKYFMILNQKHMYLSGNESNKLIKSFLWYCEYEKKKPSILDLIIVFFLVAYFFMNAIKSIIKLAILGEITSEDST